eukprot:9502737-Pyramimonas_sp.AAC.1
MKARRRRYDGNHPKTDRNAVQFGLGFCFAVHFVSLFVFVFIASFRCAVSFGIGFVLTVSSKRRLSPCFPFQAPFRFKHRCGRFLESLGA